VTTTRLVRRCYTKIPAGQKKNSLLQWYADLRCDVPLN